MEKPVVSLTPLGSPRYHWPEPPVRATASSTSAAAGSGGWGRVIVGSILVAGVAIGAAALAMRRRRQREVEVAELAEKLCDALAEGNEAAALECIRAGADPNIPSRDRVPLHLAVELCDAPAVEALIKAGADIDARSGSGATALMVACIWGRVEAAKALVLAGANPTHVDAACLTPVHYAAKHGYLALVKLLVMAYPGVVDLKRMTDGATPLMMAAAENQRDVVSFLLANGANPNAAMDNGITPLMTAAKANYSEVVRVLAEAGARTDALAEDGRSALAIAAQYNSLAAARVLLAAGDRTHLPKAVGTAAAPIAPAAARVGGEVPAGAATPLAAATAVVAATGPVRKPVEADKSPLALACRRGHVDMIYTLAEHGADVNMALADGRPLLLALVDGIPKATGGGGADAWVAPPPPAGASASGGHPALMYRVPVIEALLDLGADPFRVSNEEAPAAAAEGGAAATAAGSGGGDDATGRGLPRTRSAAAVLLHRSAFSAARKSANADIVRLFEERAGAPAAAGEGAAASGAAAAAAGSDEEEDDHQATGAARGAAARL